MFFTNAFPKDIIYVIADKLNTYNDINSLRLVNKYVSKVLKEKYSFHSLTKPLREHLSENLIDAKAELLVMMLQNMRLEQKYITNGYFNSSEYVRCELRKAFVDTENRPLPCKAGAAIVKKFLEKANDFSLSASFTGVRYFTLPGYLYELLDVLDCPAYEPILLESLKYCASQAKFNFNEKFYDFSLYEWMMIRGYLELIFIILTRDDFMPTYGLGLLDYASQANLIVIDKDGLEFDMASVSSTFAWLIELLRAIHFDERANMIAASKREKITNDVIDIFASLKRKQGVNFNLMFTDIQRMLEQYDIRLEEFQEKLGDKAYSIIIGQEEFENFFEDNRKKMRLA